MKLIWISKSVESLRALIREDIIKIYKKGHPSKWRAVTGIQSIIFNIQSTIRTEYDKP